MIPVNRHILLTPGDENAEEDKSTILLPEDYKEKSRFATGTVLSISSDCKIPLKQGDKIVYDNSLLQEIVINNKTIYLLLENYVLCSLEEDDL